MTHRHAVVITAAGSSRRFNESLEKGSDGRDSVGMDSVGMDSVGMDSVGRNGSDGLKGRKKEFLQIEGLSILYRSVSAFLSVDGLSAVVVTYRKGDEQAVLTSLGDIPSRLEGTGIPFFLVEGGETRQASVFNGLLQLERSGVDFDLVSIHDGARPFVTSAVITDCLDKACEHGGAVACVPVSDTLLRASDDGCISGAIDRKSVFRAQTPQTFSFNRILQAHRKAAAGGLVFTDDTQVFIAAGGTVAVACGDERNIKITYAGDLKAHDTKGALG